MAFTFHVAWHVASGAAFVADLIVADEAEQIFETVGLLGAARGGSHGEAIVGREGRLSRSGVHPLWVDSSGWEE